MAQYRFIIYWCNEGLEGIVPIELDGGRARAVAAALSDEEYDDRQLGQTLKYMELRSRANSQRHYECYSLLTTDIDEENLRSLFEDSPQMIVNLIREKGVHIFGKPASRTKPLIQ